MGLFPCRKKVSREDGVVTLEPSYLPLSLLRLFVSLFLCYGPSICVQTWYINMHYWDWHNNSNAYFYNTTCKHPIARLEMDRVSSVDTFAHLTHVTTFMFFQVCNMTWFYTTMKQSLRDLQQFFRGKYSDKNTKTFPPKL